MEKLTSRAEEFGPYPAGNWESGNAFMQESNWTRYLGRWPGKKNLSQVNQLGDSFRHPWKRGEQHMGGWQWDREEADFFLLIIEVVHEKSLEGQIQN